MHFYESYRVLLLQSTKVRWEDDVVSVDLMFVHLHVYFSFMLYLTGTDTAYIDMLNADANMRHSVAF